MGDETFCITSGEVSVYRIPTDQPEESDGTAVWDATTLVLVELRCGDQTGLGFTYSDEAAAHIAKELIEKKVLGGNAFDIPTLHAAMDRFTRNMGRPGLVSTAISAIDICLWDLKARLLNVSLVKLLGQARQSIPAYGSGGFTSYTYRQLRDQLGGWAANGFKAVKMKIGREPEKDITRVKQVAEELAGNCELFVDANGAYKRKQALAKANAFAPLGVTWFEEPVSSDDLAGLRVMVQEAPPGMRVAAGEYIYVLDDAKTLLHANAVDVLQADVTRCGGVSNFEKIAGVCEMNHVPLSAHTSPSIHSSLCCAFEAAINVEYFHDHARIEDMFFDGAAKPSDGLLKPDAARPGLGLDFKRSAAEEFLKLSLRCN
jgi:L-alanine-DL-glutamate epimerase-like enolase superfamily enzyme